MTTTVSMIDEPSGDELVVVDGLLQVSNQTLLAGEDIQNNRIITGELFDFQGNCSIAPIADPATLGFVVKDGPAAGACIEILAADSGETLSIYDDNQVDTPNTDNLIAVLPLDTAGISRTVRHKFETGISVIFSAGSDTGSVSVGVG